MSKIKRIIEIEEDTLKFVQELTEIIIPARSGKTLQKNVIEAIKFSKPYDDSGDCISRSELMKAIGTMVEAEMPIDEKWALGLKHSLKVIDNAPTVEPRIEYGKDGQPYKLSMTNGKEYDRPQGEWIIVKDEKYGDNVKCPFCGKELAGTDLNFCVKCGADMKGGAE